jgi:hypothetical protein
MEEQEINRGAKTKKQYMRKQRATRRDGAEEESEEFKISKKVHGVQR